MIVPRAPERISRIQFVSHLNNRWLNPLNGTSPIIYWATSLAVLSFNIFRYLTASFYSLYLLVLITHVKLGGIWWNTKRSHSPYFLSLSSVRWHLKQKSSFFDLSGFVKSYQRTLHLPSIEPTTKPLPSPKQQIDVVANFNVDSQRSIGSKFED